MIKIKNLSFSYGEKLVINNLSLDIKKGEKIWISGPSGCGKTTLIKLILGLLSADGGNIDLGDMTPSVVFQENRLLPFKSVIDNITFVGGSRKKGLENLAALGIGDECYSKPAKLSGGMKRRAAIARALSVPFDLLILDEAFNGIDEQNLEKTAILINEVCRNKTVILITHSEKEAKLLNCKKVEINN